MIKKWKDYREYIKSDQIANQDRCSRKDNILLEHSYYIMKYLRLLRLDEYLSNKGKLFILPKIMIRRWRNSLGVKLGITICPNVFDKGLLIWHYGNIVVNGGAQIGKNCILHGDNCIGNNGDTNLSPRIGDNVDIGVGAKIIGDVYIANRCKIGAGAVVVHSCYTEGATLVGIPAKELDR